MKPVAASTEEALRGALTRLVAGNATRTDGRLTVANLAREARVSRATANRAPVVLGEMRKAADAVRLSRLEKPRSPHVNAERNQRELENVIAQHVQVRALLQRIRESRRSNQARIGLIGNSG